MTTTQWCWLAVAAAIVIYKLGYYSGRVDAYDEIGEKHD